MAGKGDKQRPRQVDRKTYEQNWERAFGRRHRPLNLPADRMSRIERAIEMDEGFISAGVPRVSDGTRTRID